MEHFTRLHEHLRAHVEGMMQTSILLYRPYDGVFAPAEKNIVVAELETRHRRVGEAAHVL